MTLIWTILFSLSPFTATAGHSNVSIFICEVVSFDKKNVTGKCDPAQPKALMKIPRAWLADAQNLRLGGTVRLSASPQLYEKWKALNSRGKK